MNVREALKVVLEAVRAATDSLGSPADRAKVKAYMESPLTATFATYLYVGKIPVANFYAHANDHFDKSSLWQEIGNRAGTPNLKQPKWDVNTPLMDLALWVHAHAGS